MTLNESIVEDAALEGFGELGHAVGHGPLNFQPYAPKLLSREIGPVAKKVSKST